MSGETPFELKSTKTRRSPPTSRSSSPGRIPSPVDRRTHHQPKELPAQQIHNKIKEQQTVPKPIVIKVEPIEETETTTMANIKEIQQNIASFVPEFSGEENAQITNNLTRFLGTADSVYNMLTTNEEKRTFGKLIKFRLTGNAYARIVGRQIDDYETLRSVLNNMYSRVQTLSELERNCTNIRESYGETIRNYGYRLIEAIENYKNGYKLKYKVAGIDQTYLKHLNDTAIQSFKQGLNNTILKEKVATIRAKDVDEIIDETETMERMLEMTTGMPTKPTLLREPLRNNQMYSYRNQTNSNQTNHRQLICNYCQRPNHTYDVCRSRIRDQSNRQFGNRFDSRYDTTQYQQYNTIPTKPYSPNIPQNQSQSRFYQQRQQDTAIRHTPQAYANQNHDQNPHVTLQPSYRHTIAQTNNGYRQTPNQNYIRDRPPKYCSYCKTTIGHTFEECRNKLRPSQNQAPRNFGNPTPQEDNVERMFSNMIINTIAPYPQTNNTEQHINRQPGRQGNSNGSNQ